MMNKKRMPHGTPCNILIYLLARPRGIEPLTKNLGDSRQNKIFICRAFFKIAHAILACHNNYLLLLFISQTGTACFTLHN